ncbi:ArsR/SmtB family transcription factor [Saccharopolyspora sp. 5N708]|uniref:ArsR/SmtB family transcription factor n=1 Tax=Saccharopolyspora sp. 5N708 TaxID=3457424 RepID=UPI003FD18D3C
MLDVAVIHEPSAAAVTLEPVRARLLHELAEPGSASSLAAELGLSRQKVNYYLRGLEKHGLIELVEERRKGNMTERVMRATAGAYVISPSACGPVAPDPSRSPDRLSAQWLLAVAARLVQDVGALIGAGAKAGKRVATFAIDGEIRFAGAAERAAFAQELSDAVAGLVAKYHDEGAARGRRHRIVVGLHPSMSPVEEGRDGA